MLNKVKGLGPKTIEKLNKLGIYTLDDLLTYYPFRYNYLSRSDLNNINEEEKAIIDGEVASDVYSYYFKRLNRLNFRLSTIYGFIEVIIFNRSFLKDKLKKGTKIIITGKYDKSSKRFTASDLEFGLLTEKPIIRPVYHLTKGLTNKNLNKYINEAFLIGNSSLDDYIPCKYIDKYNFMSKKLAVNIVHNPPGEEKLNKALNRLKYEELFSFMFKINYLKEEREKESKGLEKNVKDEVHFWEVIDKLPFKLTGDQLSSLEIIVDDLRSPRQMNRILQGDVGSGKTIVSFLSIYFNYLSGYQSALMAPTEILAVQHYNNFKELAIFKDMNVSLLTGSLSLKEKKEVYKDLIEGEIDLVIGTHALFQDDVIFKSLGLVITDEQHRFGVRERHNFKNKGVMPDILYMSATPIPRTYALTIYGDMDISSIKERPKGQMPIKTLVKSEEDIKDVLSLIYEELKSNHQIYVVAPLIEGDEESELKDTKELEENMKLAFGKKYKIETINGKMKSEAKELVMSEFKAGHIDILISTTVIEVGVDVPNATMMVIYNAERFGLSTLHQLRGRVGRGSSKSTCILIGSLDNPRLKIMSEINDGFKLAEEDFKLRGSGDLFGVRQSGDMAFKLADIRRDFKILLDAKEDSKEYLMSKDSDIIKEGLITELQNRSS